MLRTNAPQAIRTLRRAKGWRQSDLAGRSGVSRELISRLERGGLRSVTIASLEKVTSALGASVDLVLRWEGAELDRLVDALHAKLQERVAAVLGQLGWLTRVEVSFNHYGDRGRVDVLAFNQGTRTVVVVEVKSAIGDVQETLGRLDVKVRLAKAIATEAGWPDIRAAVPCLALRDTRAVRRVVAQHATLFARFATRGRGHCMDPKAGRARPQRPALVRERARFTRRDQ